MTREELDIAIDSRVCLLIDNKSGYIVGSDIGEDFIFVSRTSTKLSYDYITIGSIYRFTLELKFSDFRFETALNYAINVISENEESFRDDWKLFEVNKPVSDTTGMIKDFHGEWVWF